MKWDLVVGAVLPLQVTALARLSYQARPSWADGVFLLDARLGRDLLEGNVLEVYLEGQNLGDVTYEERPGVPLPGLRLLLGLRLTW